MDSDKILSKIRRRMKQEAERNADFAAYDDMDSVKWKFPFALRTWERQQVSTAPHDALKTAYNIFDTNHPKWEILPYGPQDKDRAEERERWLEWQMIRANQHGDGEPFREILHHSSKYNMIAAQLDYLPYWLPANKSAWSKEQKVAMQNGPFCITLHHPGTVYYQYGKYVLQWVARVAVVPVTEVLEHWGVYVSDSDEGKRISRAVKQLNDLLEEDDEAQVIVVDYTDYDRRYVVCWGSERDTVADSDLETPGDLITILDGDNPLSFINWVIVRGNSTPLLYSIHKGAIWENTNLIKTIKTSNVLRRGYSAIYKHKQGPSGKALDIDFSAADPVAELEEAGQGEDVDVMQPQPLDPGFTQLDAENMGEMGMSTGVRQLQYAESPANVQYATINAFIQLAMSQLEPYTRNAEKAAIGLAKLAFLWVAESGDIVPAYRSRSKGVTKPQGQQIDIGPVDFDPEQLFISCEFIPNTPTDKMQLVNMFSTLIQAGAQLPWGEVLERLSLGFPEPLREKWQDEQIQGLALQLFMEKMKGQVGLELQQIQGALQMSLQEAAMANQPQGQPVQGAATGQGFNSAMGGSPNQQMAPQMTQTAMQEMAGPQG